MAALDRSSILQQAAEHERELATIRLRIRSLEDEVLRLRAHETRVNLALLGCLQQLVPIQRLPDDILREVFIRTLPTLRREITFSTKEAPIQLLHVCSRWRQVAQDLSPLWRSLRLVFGFTANIGIGDERVIELLEDWVPRNKGSSMSLQLIQSHRRNLIFPRLPTPGLLTAAIPSIGARLSRLTLNRILLSSIHPLPRGSFPVLERLVLRTHSMRGDSEALDWDDIGPIVAFEDCPKLQRVALSESFIASPDYEPSSMTNCLLLPWNQLTHYLSTNDRDSSYQFLIWALPRCTNLRYLCIGLSDEDMGRQDIGAVEGWGRIPVIHSLDKVSDLILSAYMARYGCLYYPDFFDKYEFPNLRTLRICADIFTFTDEAVWTPTIQAVFLDKLRNLQGLETLSLTTIYTPPAETLEAIFRAVPGITTLDLAINRDYEGFFSTFLDIEDRSDTLLPNLSTLILDLGSTNWSDNGRGVAIDPIEFTAFIAARTTASDCKPPKRLKVVFYASAPSQIDGLREENAFLREIMEFCGSIPQVDIEKRLVMDGRAQRLSDEWADRDPELEDWGEVWELFRSPYAD